MEATEEMLVAGLKETEPLGELVDWREGFGRAEMATAFRAMMAEAWRPIETAPAGQDMILAGVMDHPDDWRIKIGHRAVPGETAFHGFKIYGSSWEPLLWMPMPDKPSNAELT